MINSIEKEMPGKGDLSEKEQLIKLASESAAEEKELSDFMDMKYEMALEKYLKENPGKTEDDYINAIRRISLESGGKVVDLNKYRKEKDVKIKELDLASMFTPDRTLSSLSSKERDAVNTLLKLTFGKKD
ncbi:MAG: hypothetical protein L7S72_05980 [Flavobacteriales bacterium]|nr:hypothetical protein [Flavobacteriales bacterium]